MTEALVHRGLTWDHPRGHAALTRAAEDIATLRGAPLLRWDRQKLEGFESQPVGELAREYDLLVLDHPHIGEAAALDCLVPLEDLFAAEQIAGWQARTIGRAMESYRWAGRHWALPLDVATQVMAWRPDLLDAEPPTLWPDIVRLGEHRPVALSLAGPHAALHFLAICAALGEEPGGDDFVATAPGLEALDTLHRLYARAPKGLLGLNPIGLLDTLARTDSIALVPLVFGYVNYAVPRDDAPRILFGDAPSAVPGGRRGSVLGGTGIAVTKRARPSPALLDHLVWLLSPEAQAGFIPDHEGQPSARAAWRDERVNARSGQFYRRTEATVEDALLRPRHDGYIAFQTTAGAAIWGMLDTDAEPSITLARLRALWRESVARARTPRADTGAYAAP